MNNGYTLQLVRVKGRAKWAVKATVGSVSRYRGFYYKAEAQRDMKRWEGLILMFFMREFHHNFFTSEESGIQETGNRVGINIDNYADMED